MRTYVVFEMEVTDSGEEIPTDKEREYRQKLIKFLREYKMDVCHTDDDMEYEVTDIFIKDER
jgi:hypothetical protein